ncbi:MAG: xanthine dehydrogenase molybdopterin binding subunit [Burkholderiales bacterium]|nr:xanthine dehydrogenase molybdopterin binding subunit [Burkholderiales bacterium]
MNAPVPHPLEAAAGDPVRHESAHLQVAGGARYIDDVPEPAGTLHAAFGTSPHAHARIRSLDLGAVRAHAGVVDVLLYTDIPGANNYGGIVADDPLLAEDLVQYHGQPIFLVVAQSHQAARRAARLAKIDFEVLPAILDVEAAIAAQSWIAPPRNLQKGDAATAIARAPHRLSGRTRCGGQDHFYLEGQIAFAWPEEDGLMKVISSTQHPTEVQHMVAHALHEHGHRVQIECRRMGGGFGGKESQPALLAAMAAVAARKTGRPVKLRLDRDDDMIITGKRHPFLLEYRVGFDDSGRIHGAEFMLASDCGYSSDLSGPVNDRAICHVDNAYFLEHVTVENLQCKTHKVSNTAFRGFGGPQGMFVIEHAIDAIAVHLGRDALDVRRANYYGVGQRDVTPYGQKVEDNILDAITDQLEATSDYRARRAELKRRNAQSPIVKRGLAMTPVKFGISFNATHFNQAGALVNIYSDGSVLVNHGGTEMGQGLFTKVAQVVARELGIALDRVQVSPTDTHKVPNTSATAASSGSDLNGMAARDACRQLRERLAAHVAGLWQVDAAAVVFAGDRVSCGPHAMDFSELAHKAWFARVSLSAQGFYATPKIHWNRARLEGRPFYYFAYGVAATQVAIDTLSGEMKIERADILHDVGTSLNPALDLGQVEGAFVQGAGWLTSEELWWDGRGKLGTHAPSTYKIPTAADVPPIFNVRLVDGQPNREPTIYRSKAVGEPPLMLALSVYHAVRDAVAAVADHRRIPTLDAPTTPEAILAAVDALRAADGGA